MKIYISCVPSELGSYGRYLASDLRQTASLYDVRLEEDFRIDGVLSLGLMAQWIQECDLLIHLAGKALGATLEAKDLPAGALPGDSRAQWEYELARKSGRETIVCFATPNAPTDASGISQSEADALRQQAHRTRILQTDKLSGSFSNSRELIDLVSRRIARRMWAQREQPSPIVIPAPNSDVVPVSAARSSRGVSRSFRPAGPAAPGPTVPEVFRCSAFYTERIEQDRVGKIVACIHLESVAQDVVREAARRLDVSAGDRIKAGSGLPSTKLLRNCRIDVTPDIPGLQFDTLQASMTVWDDQQFVEFRYKPTSAAQGELCRGWIHFWLDGVLLADVAVSILVEADDVPAIFSEALTHANARPYRFVFPSYSHQDSEAVESLEAYAESFGDTYLRDVKKLRTGQNWKDELDGFIRKADIVQLFWSSHAASSKYVELEWQNALRERQTRPDPHFLRPVYWTEAPGDIPDDLRPIHFAKVPSLGSPTAR